MRTVRVAECETPYIPRLRKPSDKRVARVRLLSPSANYWFMLIMTPKVTREEKDKTKSELQGKTRSSGFELLRITAMLMIVLHHHIVRNQFNPVDTGWSLK